MVPTSASHDKKRQGRTTRRDAKENHRYQELSQVTLGQDEASGRGPGWGQGGSSTRAAPTDEGKLKK